MCEYINKQIRYMQTVQIMQAMQPYKKVSQWMA